MGLVLRGAYLALLAWQVAWHGLLPEPAGSESPVLALGAALPLLLPLRGVLRLRARGVTWASYLLILYLMVGVTESWSNPSQRAAALVQVGLVCVCLAAVVYFNRRQAREFAE